MKVNFPETGSGPVFDLYFRAGRKMMTNQADRGPFDAAAGRRRADLAMVFEDGGITRAACPILKGNDMTIPPGVSLSRAVMAAEGTNDHSAPATIAAFDGKVTGNNLTKTADIIAGVVGTLDVTGTSSSEFPVSGVVGCIQDGVTECDAGVTAMIGRDTIWREQGFEWLHQY